MTRRSLGLALDRDGPTGRDPVVLVHAGVADRRMWDASWPTLVAHRDCLRVDLRGFGDSTSRPRQALDHVADLVGVLDDLERLGEVGCPVLLLVGGHDLDTTADAADRLAAELSDVRRLDWPDVAHLPPVERPEPFARLLLDWVDETEPVPPS